MGNKYDKMTHDEFVSILQEIVKEEGAANITIPGVYEILAEHFNNEILTRWEERRG